MRKKQAHDWYMITVDGIEYLTKEETAARGCEFAAAHPGSEFHNYAHHKRVSRPITDEELEAHNRLQEVYTDATGVIAL